jgi:predicted CopG family antitoxin
MIRSIEIDEDAYERLEQVRRGAESHSEVIRRCVPRRRPVEEILRLLGRSRLSDETLEQIDESVSRRRRTPRRRGS